MQRKFRAKRILLAGASMLALMAGATGASAEMFDFSGMAAVFTAPTNGLYDITVKGAQGGGATGLAVFSGGQGAVAGGEIFLTAGTELLVIVGGQGASGDFGVGYGGGGGGRSEVDGLGNVLAIAGGGGGASEAQNGGSGLTGPNGGAGTNSSGGAGGTSGSGGGGGVGAGGGGGGGSGHSGAGSNGVGSLYGGQGGNSNQGGQYKAVGGFGGGGGAGGDGGGGGGGGGSFVSELLGPGFEMAGANSGNGYVSIDLATPAVPEASTWAMMLAGFGGMGAMALRMRRKAKLA